MIQEEIKQRLINNDSLFEYIHVIEQKFDILPNDKEHIGASIEYQDLYEMRTEFLEELVDSVVNWVFSSEKYLEMEKHLMLTRKKEKSAVSSEIVRKAHNKFRKSDSGILLVQGQIGELLLFHFVQRYFKAIPLLRKMSITTSPKHERFGADAIHYKLEDGKNIIILGEAKTYTSKYGFAKAFEDAVDSIIDTYNKHKRELNLYLHEDFLDRKMNELAEEYLNNTMKNVEVHLVNIVLYNETIKMKKDNEADIKKQIDEMIKKRYKDFDNSKIDIKTHKILKRVTYIIFPVWELEELARKFESMI